MPGASRARFLYHGFLEAKPVTDKTSKLVYTLMYDVSDKPDKAAKDADAANRKMRFARAREHEEDRRGEIALVKRTTHDSRACQRLQS